MPMAHKNLAARDVQPPRDDNWGAWGLTKRADFVLEKAAYMWYI
jgi:hypothetical protein